MRRRKKNGVIDIAELFYEGQVQISLENFDNDELAEEICLRIAETDNSLFFKKPRPRFVEIILTELKEKGFVIAIPKYIVQQSMLEDFITENNIND